MAPKRNLCKSSKRHVATSSKSKGSSARTRVAQSSADRSATEPQVGPQVGPERIQTSRHHSNEDIEEAVFKMFLHCRTKNLSMSMIRSGPTPGRTFYESNVTSISTSARKGFTGHEAIGAWMKGDYYYCIYGNQRYLANQQGEGITIPCLILEGLSNRTKEELEFGALTAFGYSPRPAARSYMSNISEVRTVLKWIAERGKPITAIIFADVQRFYPKIVGRFEDHEGTTAHWTQGPGGVNNIMMVLSVAKVFAQSGMENIIDDIERTCHDPVKQVSRNVLMDIKNFELLKPSAGKQVLKRYFEELRGPSGGSSSRTHSHKNLKLSLSAEQHHELKRLQPAEKEGLERSEGEGSSSRVDPKQLAIEKFESGISSLKKGIATWEKSSESNDRIQSIKKLAGELESAIASLK